MEFYKDMVITADEQLCLGQTAGAQETLEKALASLDRAVHQFSSTPLIAQRLSNWRDDARFRLQNIRSAVGSMDGSMDGDVAQGYTQSVARCQKAYKNAIERSTADVAACEWVAAKDRLRAGTGLIDAALRGVRSSATGSSRVRESLCAEDRATLQAWHNVLTLRLLLLINRNAVVAPLSEVSEFLQLLTQAPPPPYRDDDGGHA